MEHVILVDENDREIGTMEKLEAHRKGVLHRAFSVLLFNSKGEILLQKRSEDKYHSGGLWTNTCCSHPFPGEPMEEAVQRKLGQEMGINVPAEFAYKFIYRITLEDNLVEHELDHVYVGRFDGTPKINPAEVADWRFASLEEVRSDAATRQELYTHWFRLILSHPHLSMPVTVIHS